MAYFELVYCSYANDGVSAISRNALCYLLGTGSIFPIAIMLGNVLKLDLLSKNPLGVLGGIVGGIQAFYLPVWIIIYIEHPNLLPMAIGVLGASHFLPYIWIYRSLSYGIFTVAMAVVSFIFGYVVKGHAFSTLPFILTAIYLITVFALYTESRAIITNQGNVKMKRIRHEDVAIRQCTLCVFFCEIPFPIAKRQFAQENTNHNVILFAL